MITPRFISRLLLLVYLGAAFHPFVHTVNHAISHFLSEGHYDHHLHSKHETDHDHMGLFNMPLIEIQSTPDRHMAHYPGDLQLQAQILPAEEFISFSFADFHQSPVKSVTPDFATVWESPSSPPPQF